MDMTPLIDSRIIAQTFALRRKVSDPAPKSSGPVLSPGQAYGSVLKDDGGHWRMWYLARPHYCEYFATSADGVHWDCPDLDFLHPDLKAKTESGNAFLSARQRDDRGRWLVQDKGPEGFCVIDAESTPHPAAKRRYAAMYLARGAETGTGLFLAHSDDGLHWFADESGPVMEGWRDTANQFFYDPRRRKYLWYGRPEAFVSAGHQANRVIAMRESEDMIHWNPERTVLDTDDLDADPDDLLDELTLRMGESADNARARAAEAARLTETENVGEDTPCIRGRNRQWYGMTVFPYANLLVGLGWMYDVPGGEIWTELLHSYDGIDWRRECGRRPFLPHTPGTMRHTMSTAPVPIGDELWIFSSVCGYNHHGVPMTGITSGIEAHSIMRDRWVGYFSGPREGELLTQPLARGRKAALNARIEDGGHIRFAALDADGAEIRGFGLDESIPLQGDGLCLDLSWEGGGRLQDLPSNCSSVRLRLAMRKAAVFGIQV